MIKNGWHKYGPLNIRYDGGPVLAIDLKLWVSNSEITYNHYFGLLVFFWRGSHKFSLKVWGRKCLCINCNCRRIRKIEGTCYVCYESC